MTIYACGSGRGSAGTGSLRGVQRTVAAGGKRALTMVGKPKNGLVRYRIPGKKGVSTGHVDSQGNVRQNSARGRIVGRLNRGGTRLRVAGPAARAQAGRGGLQRASAASKTAGARRATRRLNQRAATRNQRAAATRARNATGRRRNVGNPETTLAGPGARVRGSRVKVGAGATVAGLARRQARTDAQRKARAAFKSRQRRQRG
jgi:hypothetical protein